MSEIAYPVLRIEKVHMNRTFSPPQVGYIWLWVVIGDGRKKITRDYQSTDREFNRDVGRISESFKSRNRTKDLVAIVRSANSTKFERLEIRSK